MSAKIFRLIAVAVVCQLAVACGSDDDEGLKKTYADDDFVMTERNIREKIVGSWEVADVWAGGGWTAVTDSFLEANKHVTMRADGSCDLFQLADAKYRVSKDSVCISVLGLYVDNLHGSTMWRPITSEFTLSEANKWKDNMADYDGYAAIEYRETGAYIVKGMAKGEFQVETADREKTRYRLVRR